MTSSPSDSWGMNANLREVTQSGIMSHIMPNSAKQSCLEYTKFIFSAHKGGETLKPYRDENKAKHRKSKVRVPERKKKILCRPFSCMSLREALMYSRERRVTFGKDAMTTRTRTRTDTKGPATHSARSHTRTPLGSNLRFTVRKNF